MGQVEMDLLPPDTTASGPQVFPGAVHRWWRVFITVNAFRTLLLQRHCLNWVLFPESDLAQWQSYGFTGATIIVGYSYLN